MIILDRLEETLAVLETDDGMVNVPRELLPADVREGDVLRQAADGRSEEHTSNSSHPSSSRMPSSA